MITVEACNHCPFCQSIKPWPSAVNAVTTSYCSNAEKYIPDSGIIPEFCPLAEDKIDGIGVTS